uniref:Uncharacterized protein n=1 Tax=Aegilops tauschii subsp. strangulata TaxID=200361 RepID=A0A453RGW6_AEGTS
MMMTTTTRKKVRDVIKPRIGAVSFVYFVPIVYVYMTHHKPLSPAMGLTLVPPEVSDATGACIL